ncbi:hypothetical protein ACSVDA_15500 [Cytobacillus sp. Hm23]
MSKDQKYSKSAFIDAASKKERFVLQAVLIDGESYTKKDVEKLAKEWKSKEVKA